MRFNGIQCMYSLPFTHCNETYIYVLPEKEWRGLNTNFHIHVSVNDLYCVFPGSGSVHIISCSIIGRPIVRIYTVNVSQTRECGKWD